MFAGSQREWERDAARRGHSAIGGGFGVGFLAPTNEKGELLTDAEKAAFEMKFGGRMHHLNSHGQLRFVDTEAFSGALSDALEKEQTLLRLSSYVLGGNDLVKNFLERVYLST